MVTRLALGLILALLVATGAEASGISGALPKPWLDVRSYGAKCDATNDDTTAIQAAINALPVTGGVINLPAGSCKITTGLTIGNGSASSVSTLQHITFRGTGSGVTDAEIIPAGGQTTLLWFGAAGGTLLTVNGPISAVTLEGIHFHGKGSTNAAATCLALNHPVNSTFRDLSCTGYTTAGYTITAYDGSQSGVGDGGFVTGANNNVWIRVSAYAPATGATTAIGLRIGATTTGSAPSLDVAGNTWIGGTFTGGADGIGMELRFTDHLKFLGTSFTVMGGGTTGVGIKVSPPSGSADFPASITCVACVPLGSTWALGLSGTGWTGNDPILFLPWPMSEAPELPPTSLAWGVTSRGDMFGTWTKNQAPLSTGKTISLVASSSAISNTTSETAFSKSYAGVAGELNVAGTVLDIHASGTYSTTGSPLLTLKLRLGGSGGILVNVQTLTVNNASGERWEASARVTVRSTGASNTLVRTQGLVALNNVAAPGGLGTTLTLDTTGALAVDGTATWSAASSSNTITMDQLIIKIAYPTSTIN